MKYGSRLGPVGSLTNLSMAGVKSAGAIIVEASRLDNLKVEAAPRDDLNALVGTASNTEESSNKQETLPIEGIRDPVLLELVDGLEDEDAII